MRESIIFIIIVLLVSAAVVFLIIRSYRRQMKTTMERLVHKLNLAMEGTYPEIPYNENMESLIDSKLNRYMEMLREQSKKNEKEKEAVKSLISDITHQTKTPLANILLQAQLAKEAKGITPELYEHLEQIDTQADKLNFLISSLVKASYLEGGLIHIHTRKEELAPLLETVKQELVMSAHNKGIRIKMQQEQNPDTFCQYDYKWTKEALINILDNAVKYSQPDAEISIQLEKLEMFLRINIKDNGMGIKEEEFGQIFTRFYRSPDAAKLPGVGLGLYLAREIVSLQGGYIKVQSEWGKGTTFSVYLPIA